MPISFTLPLVGEKPSSVKDMIFMIISTEYPLSIIEMLHLVKRRYNISVSFQSVRKAALSMVDAHVLVKNGKKFSINKEWILDASKFMNRLQRQYFSEGQSVNKIAVGPNMASYTFSRLVDSDIMWNTIITDNFANNPHQPKIAVFSAVHFWWVLATLVQETELYNSMRKQGIKSYFICHGETPLDKWTVQFYNGIYVSCKQMPKPKDFVNGHNIGVYGDVIIQSTYPKELAKKIDDFFRKHKRIEHANLPELVELSTAKYEIVITVIKDTLLAKSIRERIVANF